MKMITQVPKLKPREKTGHKGDFGRILIVGGSVGYSGAAAIAGRAALRSGAGLVCVAVPASVISIVAGIEPCYMTLSLPQDNDGAISADAGDVVTEAAGKSDVVAFGPGAGVGRGTRDVLVELIRRKNLRLVIDADGLNCLAKTGGWIEKKKAMIVLTPHPGEMKRLWTALFRKALPTDRTEQAAELAERAGCVVALKGAATVVTDGQSIYINTTGNAGMATGGAGDVLTGVIAALAGQGMDNFDAAVAAVYVHGLAGDIAAAEKGQISLIAADIVDKLPDAFRKLCEF